MFFYFVELLSAMKMQFYLFIKIQKLLNAWKYVFHVSCECSAFGTSVITLLSLWSLSNMPNAALLKLPNIIKDIYAN